MKNLVDIMGIPIEYREVSSGWKFYVMGKKIGSVDGKLAKNRDLFLSFAEYLAIYVFQHKDDELINSFRILDRIPLKKEWEKVEVGGKSLLYGNLYDAIMKYVNAEIVSKYRGQIAGKDLGLLERKIIENPRMIAGVPVTYEKLGANVLSFSVKDKNIGILYSSRADSREEFLHYLEAVAIWILSNPDLKDETVKIDKKEIIIQPKWEIYNSNDELKNLWKNMKDFSKCTFNYPQFCGFVLMYGDKNKVRGLMAGKTLGILEKFMSYELFERMMDSKEEILGIPVEYRLKSGRWKFFVDDTEIGTIDNSNDKNNQIFLDYLEKVIDWCTTQKNPKVLDLQHSKVGTLTSLRSNSSINLSAIFKLVKAREAELV